jgi:recombination protein RecA
MLSASALRLQIESALSSRIPSALTPAPKLLRPVAATRIAALDEQLDGGLPVGAISELAGPECSGRTSVALAFVAALTLTAKVCAWVDVSDVLDPVAAAAAGVDLARLLWVRCGVEPSGTKQQLPLPGFALPEQYLAAPPIRKGLHGGGFGPHPRTETRGLENAILSLLDPRCAEPQRRIRRETVSVPAAPAPLRHAARVPRPSWSKKPWDRMDQALRATDLLLQAGGFSAIVLDMGGIAPKYAARVPLATWFRWRAAAERTQTSLVLLAQESCAQSSAEVLVRFSTPGPGHPREDATTVLAGMEGCAAVDRRRFPGMRKPSQRVRDLRWTSRMAWVGR